jgi:hypothetical protein
VAGECTLALDLALASYLIEKKRILRLASKISISVLEGESIF